MKYRKKPVVIDAEVYKFGLGLEDGIEPHVAVNKTNYEIIKAWYGKDVAEDNTGLVELPFITTLEGNHYISPGDFIITGVKGERYPCKPDIFAMTYEKVDVV